MKKEPVLHSYEIMILKTLLDQTPEEVNNILSEIKSELSKKEMFTWSEQDIKDRRSFIIKATVYKIAWIKERLESYFKKYAVVINEDDEERKEKNELKPMGKIKFRK